MIEVGSDLGGLEARRGDERECNAVVDDCRAGEGHDLVGVGDCESGKSENCAIK